MDTNSDKNKQKSHTNQNPVQKKDFFQLTRHQLSVNIEKYEDALKVPPVTIFNSKQVNREKIIEQNLEIFSKRINSTDSAMLEESAYVVLDNVELKLEKKIENCENLLKDIAEKLVVADAVNDEKSKKELMLRKKIFEKQLANLQMQYKNQNFETNLTSLITKIINYPKVLKENCKKAIKSFFRHSKLLRRYTPIVKSIMVKDTLVKLNKINKSVDELVKMQVPFGEQEERYNKLVNHLSHAGALHAQILKELQN